MRRVGIGAACLGLLLAAGARGAAPPVVWRFLTPEEQEEVDGFREQLRNHTMAGEFEKASRVADRIAAYRRERQGADHWQAVDARLGAARCKQLVSVPAPDRAAIVRAWQLEFEGKTLLGRGRFREAEKPLRAALASVGKSLRPGHPEVVRVANTLAACLHRQGRWAESLRLFRDSLAALEKAAGKGHPDSAACYFGVAYSLDGLGRPSEALPLYRRSVEVREEALGWLHPETAMSYGGLASCLENLGRHGEALGPYVKALAVQKATVGEGHRLTTACYNNLGGCLMELNRPSDAVPLFRKALAARERTLEEGHPDLATSYNSVGSCLQALGQPAEALPFFRKALAVNEAALGEDHPHTNAAVNNLAVCLDALGRRAEALRLHKRALDGRRAAVGEDHPSTATGYNNVALCLHALGRRGEALPLFRKALAISERALGPDHPDTAASYNHLGFCLYRQGEHRQAARLWQRSLPAQEAARLRRVGSGFDRAQANARGGDAHSSLAIALARLGQPTNAFRHAEASLARGLLDDLDSLSPAEQARVRELRRRMREAETVLASISQREGVTSRQRARHEEARREYGRLSGLLADLLRAASSRRVQTQARIQEALPDDAALVVWIDNEAMDEYWACVLRRSGPPAWERLAGSGKAGEWTRDDSSLWLRAYRALIDPASADADRRRLLADLAAQRIGPIRRHLGPGGGLPAVKCLYVVPTGGMAVVPVDLIAAGLAVRHAPSGSLLVRQQDGHRAIDGSSLLALGDPAFRGESPAPPRSGVLIHSVLPGGNAFRAGLKGGDVLLQVGQVALGSADDLGAALRKVPAAVTYWREGRTLKGRLPAAPLGAVVDPRSAPAAYRAWVRSEGPEAGPKRLPGTRVEVGAIAPLFKRSTVLLGSDASEQKLDELREQGRLSGFRVLHFATHGELVEAAPAHSSLLLAQDALPERGARLSEGKLPYTGRLTVERIRLQWELDADLVVLSACNTGLGKQAGGEGLLGFAQAFLSSGARSVILTRWKVDDAATSLLMVRFYENLLGKRKDLKQPMGRAAALDEAKRWLRELPRKQAGALAALHSAGELRGTVAPGKPMSKPKVPAQLPEGDRPYAHPFYWAAFVLIGDPD